MVNELELMSTADIIYTVEFLVDDNIGTRVNAFNRRVGHVWFEWQIQDKWGFTKFHNLCKTDYPIDYSLAPTPNTYSLNFCKNKESIYLDFVSFDSFFILDQYLTNCATTTNYLDENYWEARQRVINLRSYQGQHVNKLPKLLTDRTRLIPDRFFIRPQSAQPATVNSFWSWFYCC